jgi:curli biogenesis system outer membrane secretion channel CsgG
MCWPQSLTAILGAIVIASLTWGQAVQNPQVPEITDSVESEISAKLLNAKRIYVDSFGEDEINRTLQAMVIDALRKTERFIVTENRGKADLILRGSAIEKSSQEAHALGSSTAMSGAAGSRHASVRGSGGLFSGSSGGGFISRTLGVGDSQSSVETVNDARLAVRLVSRDGDVVWSATEESKGAKYKGATADVADLVVKALLRELDRLKTTVGQ